MLVIVRLEQRVVGDPLSLPSGTEEARDSNPLTSTPHKPSHRPGGSLLSGRRRSRACFKGHSHSLIAAMFTVAR
jgi:hypothetical protein